MVRGFVAALMLSAFASGCATVTRGSTEQWVLETDPSGADARLSTGLRCITPCSLELKRKRPFFVTVEKEGYEPIEAEVTSSVSGKGATGMAGNAVLGGLVGVVVDMRTGASKNLSPNPMQITLEPLDPNSEIVKRDRPTLSIWREGEDNAFEFDPKLAPSGLLATLRKKYLGVTDDGQVIWLSLEWRSVNGDAVSAGTNGDLVFLDDRDRPRLRVPWTLDSEVAPDAVHLDADSGIPFDPDSESHYWLRATKLPNMKIRFEKEGERTADSILQ